MKSTLRRQKSKIKRETKGITLIALVITIIVLLILAGISISMLGGENSILSQATNAKEKTRLGEVQEFIKLAVAGNIGEKYIEETKKSKDQVISELYSAGKLTDEEVQALEESDTITIGGITIDFSVLENTSTAKRLVEMFQKAVSDDCDNADGTCTDETHLHIGDYVNYTNPTSGEWTVPAGELGGENAQTFLVAQNQLNWRVLGIEGTGNSAYIKLISGSPMKKSKSDKSGVDESDPYLFMKGVKGYLNSIEQLNKICEKYKTDIAQKAESVTMDDIDKLTGITTDALKKQYNLEAFFEHKNYGDSYSFENQYTPESWLDSTRTTVSGTVNGYYYSINQPISSGAPYVNVSNTRIYNMLFDNVEYGSGKTYWAASLGTYAYSGGVDFGLVGISKYFGDVITAGTSNMFDSNGDERAGGCAVRPVVYLKSGVTNEQCAKISDRNETRWNVN